LQALNLQALNLQALNSDAMHLDAINVNAINVNAINLNAINLDAMKWSKQQSKVLNVRNLSKIIGRESTMIAGGLPPIVRKMQQVL
jgi:hypothetical protein